MTLKPVAGVHGATFSADGCSGAPGTAKSGCALSFRFEKAYAGDFPYRGKVARGLYVIISSSLAPACGECREIRNVQVVRNIEERSGHMVPKEPDVPVRRARSGWWDRSAASRGWRVDVDTAVTSPWFQGGADTKTGSYGTRAGDTSAPARLRDSPVDWSTDKNLGRELQTCAVCYNAGKPPVALGCVTWGYYIDGAGKLSLRPPKPIASCGVSVEFRDALARWNAMPGNEKLEMAF
ncbi:MAG TPA: hypothetical protein VG389_20550 [Myxococcota bacterium]|nr:hypothetical protein [Myxococcota bacterium]